MKLGILFSGQGSQVPEMGLDLYNKYEYIKKFYDKYPDIANLSFNADITTLSKTINTQPVLVMFHLAVLTILKKNNIKYDITAGLSLGEYSALAASGILTFEDTIKIIKKRAEFMSDDCQNNSTMLLAILGKNENEIVEYISNINKKDNLNIEIANMNCPKQVVIGINTASKEEIIKKFNNETNFKIIPLNVEGAFHTSFMNNSKIKLEKELKNYTFNPEQIPIIFNRTADFQKNHSLIDLLSNQINNTTYFHKSILKMIDFGVTTFLEIGYNNIFKGFINKIDKNIKVIPINSVESIEELKKENLYE